MIIYEREEFLKQYVLSRACIIPVILLNEKDRSCDSDVSIEGIVEGGNKAFDLIQAATKPKE